MKAFKAYDIRGHYPKDWNREDAYKIGYFLPELLNTDIILVGRDIRLSSDEIFSSLTSGINDAGANVLDIGLSTTPMVYWATARLNMSGSVQITASHNPKEHNGLKVSGKDAMPIGYANGLKSIQEWMETRECVPAEKPGKIIHQDILSEYIEFMESRVPDTANMKIAIDCSNGMAGMIIRKLLGDSPIYINEEPNGSFPAHDPNPLNPKNIIQISELVKNKGCDIGIIFDGDADRVMFVDENGDFISPDLMIAVLGHKFRKEGQKIKVLQDIRTSKSVGEYLGTMGAELHTWKVGRAFAAPRLKEIDGLYGGELAGHYYFREFNYSDSGIMAALYILGVLSDMHRSGKTVSGIIQSISNYSNSGEINFVVEDKAGAIEKVIDIISSEERPVNKFDFDGVRLEFKDWWFNIRPSNTEPYLRFLAEAKNESLLDQKIKRIKAILDPFISEK